ncbi:hypothetical protein V8C26DRAFT_73082 [Trichoderma gracile]
MRTLLNEAKSQGPSRLSRLWHCSDACLALPLPDVAWPGPGQFCLLPPSLFILGPLSSFGSEAPTPDMRAGAGRHRHVLHAPMHAAVCIRQRKRASDTTTYRNEAPSTDTAYTMGVRRVEPIVWCPDQSSQTGISNKDTGPPNRPVEEAYNTALLLMLRTWNAHPCIIATRCSVRKPLHLLCDLLKHYPAIPCHPATQCHHVDQVLAANYRERNTREVAGLFSAVQFVPTTPAAARFMPTLKARVVVYHA